MAEKKWTLMFYFAGDNNLAPGMLSQLKAIKDAGYHEHANVIVRYDPNEKGAPTMTFEVNGKQKLKARAERKAREGRKEPGRDDRAAADTGPVVQVGDGDNSFVHNLTEDIITEDVVMRPRKCRREIGRVLPPEAEVGVPPKRKDDRTPMSQAAIDLWEFLRRVQLKYRADHYVLFLIGHGMIVGNDAFLPDERPNSAIDLQELGIVMRDFVRFEEGREQGGAFELIGMHSCSMSAVEVAYELKDTAKYMMATEGVSFIGSWPYRQLLKKFYGTLQRVGGGPLDLRDLLARLFALSRHNSTDFMFGGFSADLALCNLRGGALAPLTEGLGALSAVLKEALGGFHGGVPDKRLRELILLSHWRAQSYYQENYTDLYDFCFCLWEECRDAESDLQARVARACLDVMATVDPRGAAIALGSRDEQRAAALYEEAGSDPADLPVLDDDGREDARPVPGPFRRRFDRLVVCSKQFGPAYQYSHGLSIYFPWARPVNDREAAGPHPADVLEKYREYAFTEELGEHSWLSFLELYFDQTMRRPRLAEDGRKFKKLQEAVGASAIAAASGALSKTTPSESGGDGCACPSVKNYPMEFLVEDTKAEPPAQIDG